MRSSRLPCRRTTAGTIPCTTPTARSSPGSPPTSSPAQSLPTTNLCLAPRSSQPFTLRARRAIPHPMTALLLCAGLPTPHRKLLVLLRLSQPIHRNLHAALHLHRL